MVVSLDNKTGLIIISILIVGTLSLKKEGSELATNCSRLKLLATDGKMRLTDVADTEQILRLIQSIPSQPQEPIKI